MNSTPRLTAEDLTAEQKRTLEIVCFSTAWSNLSGTASVAANAMGFVTQQIEGQVSVLLMPGTGAVSPNDSHQLAVHGVPRTAIRTLKSYGSCLPTKEGEERIPARYQLLILFPIH